MLLDRYINSIGLTKPSAVVGFDTLFTTLSDILVTVWKLDDNGDRLLDPAPIYSSKGGIPKGNPFVTDDTGLVDFFAEQGEYEIDLSDNIIPERISDTIWNWAAIPEPVVKENTAQISQRMRIVHLPINLRDRGGDYLGSEPVNDLITSLATEGDIFVPAGNWTLDGRARLGLSADFKCAGAGSCKFSAIDPSAQICRGNPDDRASVPDSPGGVTSGFTFDGDDTAIAASGGFYVGQIHYHLFEDIKIIGCAGDNMIVEGAQNNTFLTLFSAASGGDCIVLDYGAGGNHFVKPEIAVPGAGNFALVFRQTGKATNSSQYPETFGPQSNIFSDPQIEFTDNAAGGLIYHGAGRRNKILMGGVGTLNLTLAQPVIVMDHDCNVFSFNGNLTAGSNIITGVTPNPLTSGVSLNMALKAAGVPRQAFVVSATSNTITISANASVTAIGTEIGVGAGSSELSLIDCSLEGTPLLSKMITMNGSCEISLLGRCEVFGVSSIFETRSTDIIRVDPRFIYSGVTNIWTQVAGDSPATTFEDLLQDINFPHGSGVLATRGDSAQLQLRGKALSRILFNNSNAAANERKWQIATDASSGDLYFALMADDELSQAVPIHIHRGAGLAIDLVEINSTVKLVGSPAAGGFSVFGATPSGQKPRTAVPTDLASCIAAIAELTQVLVDFGFESA